MILYCVKFDLNKAQRINTQEGTISHYFNDYIFLEICIKQGTKNQHLDISH